MKQKRERARKIEKGREEGRDHTENRDAFAILRSVVRTYCVGRQRGRQNVKCGRIARWEREIEQRNEVGEKIELPGFHWRAIYCHGQFLASYPQRENTNGNQEFARATATVTAIECKAVTGNDNETFIKAHSNANDKN